MVYQKKKNKNQTKKHPKKKKKKKKANMYYSDLEGLLQGLWKEAK